MLRLVLAACCAAACAPRAFACSCELTTMSKAKGRAEVVFAGTVLDSHRERSAEGTDAHEWRVRLSVEQRWKGDGEGTVVVYTSGTCRSDFEAGRKYLVFARRQEGRGRLTTDTCMMTRRLESASDEDLRKLGKAKQPKHNSKGD
ncbi:MAG TPA: hypothetical protein VER08_06300 [Pyrinomonadaceae bacterium]|nr:hypothetical protein [Pyrinomonadaceae bacterium]